MRYVTARYSEYQRELAYRIYVTDSLQNTVQGKFVSIRYADIVNPKPPEPTLTAEEIAEDVFSKIGLKVI